VGDLGIKMGYDSTTKPLSVEGKEDISYMVYRSENGGSFGVDTIFTARIKDDHSFMVKEVAVTLWAVHNVKARLNGDIVTFEFTMNGEDTTLSFPVSEIDTVGTFSDLNESEKIILKMYKDNQVVFSEKNKLDTV